MGGDGATVVTGDGRDVVVTDTGVGAEVVDEEAGTVEPVVEVMGVVEVELEILSDRPLIWGAPVFECFEAADELPHAEHPSTTRLKATGRITSRLTAVRLGSRGVPFLRVALRIQGRLFVLLGRSSGLLGRLFDLLGELFDIAVIPNIQTFGDQPCR